MKNNNKLKEHHKTLNITVDISYDKNEEETEEIYYPDNNNIFKFKDIKWVKEYITTSISHKRVLYIWNIHFPWFPRKEIVELSLDCRSIIRFDNDYYVSLISTKYSYGNENEYEIGICHTELGLVYDTHITGDVLGNLSEKDVEDTLKEVSKLPKRTKEDNDRYIKQQKEQEEYFNKELKEVQPYIN